MKKRVAKQMFDEALAAVGNQADWADIDQAETWRNLDEQTFLGAYCWVVFSTGFGVSIVEKHFEKLQEVFKQFKPDAVARMRPVRPEKLPIANKRKADGFLKGAKLVHKTGWSDFKRTCEEGGDDALKVLPWIGDETKRHLAKNIGLVDAPKPDRHLKWCTERCAAEVDELVAYLAKEYQMTEHKVDAVLWEWRRVR